MQKEVAKKIIVDYLNKCFKADPVMMQLLFSHYVKVNNLSDENPIICTEEKMTSVLGLINGMFQELNFELVYSKYDDNENLEGFM